MSHPELSERDGRHRASRQKMSSCDIVAATLTACFSSAAAVTLRTVGDGGNCIDGPWGFSSSLGCRIFSRDDIPAVTIGLFSESGAPCCGATVTTVEVALYRSQGNKEIIPMRGFLVKDSNPSKLPDASMTLRFSGIKTTNAVAGVFDLAFSSFYQGVVLEQRLVLRILPDELRLRPSILQTFFVNEILPAFTLEIIGRSTVLAEAGGIRVGARLFNKGDQADISSLSLRGLTSQAFTSGVAVFNDLRLQRKAGNGFRIAFFVEDSHRECTSAMLSATCETQEKHRGETGGLGGYWLELQSAAFILLPDRMMVSVEVSQVLGSYLRMGASLPAYTVSFYDSAFESSKLEGFVSNDAWNISISIESRSEAYPVSQFNLEGDHDSGKTVAILGNGATFRDLTIRSVVGPAFRFRFIASWTDFCQKRFNEFTCTGKCCLITNNFPVYPNSIRTSPLVLPDIIVGDALG